MVFLPKFNNRGNDDNMSDRNRRQRDIKNMKSMEKKDARLSTPDWSVVDDDDDDYDHDHHTMPDGITIDTDEFEPISQGTPVPKQLERQENLSECTVPVLKEKLKAAGLPVSGRKADLIDRLINS